MSPALLCLDFYVLTAGKFAELLSFAVVPALSAAFGGCLILEIFVVRIDCGNVSHCVVVPALNGESE